MSLTRAEFTQLETHWSLVIQHLCPSIDEIPDGGGTTISEKLSTWRSKTFAKPTVEQVEDALLNAVLPALTAAQEAEQDKVASLSDVLQRLADSPLADKTPDEIYTIMQAQIDGWGTLAQAKADLRVWLPLIVAALFWIVRRK